MGTGTETLWVESRAQASKQDTRKSRRMTRGIEVRGEERGQKCLTIRSISGSINVNCSPQSKKRDSCVTPKVWLVSSTKFSDHNLVAVFCAWKEANDQGTIHKQMRGTRKRDTSCVQERKWTMAREKRQINHTRVRETTSKREGEQDAEGGMRMRIPISIIRCRRHRVCTSRSDTYTAARAPGPQIRRLHRARLPLGHAFSPEHREPLQLLQPAAADPLVPPPGLPPVRWQQSLAALLHRSNRRSIRNVLCCKFPSDTIYVITMSLLLFHHSRHRSCT